MSTLYTIMADEFEVKPGGGKIFKLDLSAGVIVNGHRRPILAFEVWALTAPVIPPKQLEVRIDITGREQFKQTFGTDVRMFWIPVEGVLASAGNALQFRVVSGAGSIIFRNVVFWYQLNT